MLNTPFRGKGKEKLTEEQRDLIPASRAKAFTEPENYRANSLLANAVNVALLTGKPLLLTGEPGTGKTQLAFRVAWELGMDKPFKFEVKSTSVAKDLLYDFDTIGYFRSAQIKELDVKVKNFITYQALGQAILETHLPDEVSKVLPDDYTLLGSRRSVVLIDEIDKAPRDFPNDLLNELDQSYFRIPELGEKLTPKKGLAPIVIITSNSEKNLPEPFLRRCVYHHISFPEKKEDIREIITARVTNINEKSELAEQLFSLFDTARNEEMISKKPSLSEAIVWMDALLKIYSEKPDGTLDDKELTPYWGILFKKQEDLAYAVKNFPPSS